jgi:hypothetical protein
MQMIDIRYPNGEMHIDLEEFLDGKNITKFKKLLRIIQNSYEPETVDSIRNFILNYLEQVEPLMKEDFKKYVAYRDKLPYATEQYNKAVSYRNRFKRGTKGYKVLTPDVKEKREQMHYIKMCINSADRDLKKKQRQKTFYEKCLKILQESR